MEEKVIDRVSEAVNAELDKMESVEQNVMSMNTQNMQTTRRLDELANKLARMSMRSNMPLGMLPIPGNPSSSVPRGLCFFCGENRHIMNCCLVRGPISKNGIGENSGWYFQFSIRRINTNGARMYQGMSRQGIQANPLQFGSRQ